MQKFLDFISSKTFRNTFCFLLFSILMTAAISSQNFFFQKVIENGISKRDIIAQKDIKVIDTKKTELHKKEVAQAIEPILTQAEDDFIMTSLMTMHKTVIKIRDKKNSDEIKADELGILFDEKNQKVIIDFLLRADESDVNMIFDKSKTTFSPF